MKRFFLCLVVASTTFSTSFSRSLSKLENDFEATSLVSKDSLKTHYLEDVFVFGNQASSKTPVAQTNLKPGEIKELTVANNLPHVLWMTPSLVATSENGTGAGNSSFRIRGTDASRINITLNGIPLNNPESQEVYWVNIPDMTSALESIQIQRGVGTSTNGTGAFGASVHLTSKIPERNPYVESATTVGSYGTFQKNMAFGTGVFGKGYSLDMRYSNLTTDGYIRNGWCKHQSFFATLNKQFDKSDFRLNYIYGNQHTGITWEGISEDRMKNTPTFNPAGTITDGVYYDNESDNYRQHHIQAFYTRELGEFLSLNGGLNYTNGFGYYEQYKQDEKFSDMAISNQTVDGVTYQKTDLIRRKNMSNDFYTAHLNLKYEKTNFNLQAGGMYTLYEGDHYATLLWTKYHENIPAGYEWVRNNAQKTDANTFLKAEYTLLKGLNTYLDLQYRYVDYKLNGIDDDDMLDMTQHRTWNFFNPKAGLFYQINANETIFASLAMAHREPTRADIKDAYKSGGVSNIKAEQLLDYELGYTFDNQKIKTSINFYYMNYEDQLVPTGKLNEVGYKLMSNVDKSYRLGMEVQVGVRPLSWLQLDANSTWSKNRVLDYTAYYETYDNSDYVTGWNPVNNQASQHFSEAKLPFSPEWIAAGGITLLPTKSIKINLTEKYISEQYISNTQNEALKLPGYSSANISMVYTFKIKNFANAELGIYVNNLMSNQYSCNAWGYEAHFENGDATYFEKGLYPVAPRNYLAKFTLRF